MRNSIPEGTFIFLFTDIEGSTGKWEQYPDSMKTALEVHDAIMEKAISDHGGEVFKTVGDAFCAVFRTPLEAVSAITTAYLELAGHEWDHIGTLKVRAGLHLGEAIRRDNDYFGPTVNRTARIEAAAHGGQILISSELRSALSSQLPDGFELIDKGVHRLKDLLSPVRLYQLFLPGLVREFPPLRTLNEVVINLPVQMTEFIGRQDEISMLKERIDSSRLTTITGPGGTGKTRLAFQVGAEVGANFSDGTHLFELVNVKNPGHVLQEVIATLHLRSSSAESLLETLINYIGHRQMFFLFDNCEHVIESAASLIEKILCSCPFVKILATSRETLKLTGESLFQLHPLLVPSGMEDGVNTFWKNESVMLFVSRARENTDQEIINDLNMPFIQEICRKLDGIPLALELAAGRLRSLSLEQLAGKLDRRLKTLSYGKRGGMIHQQTLESVIDWSYELLRPAEKELFSRLSIFPGEFNLESVCNVCPDETLGPEEIEEVFFQLLDKSLVSVRKAARANRYFLLETLREFSKTKLNETFLPRLTEKYMEWYRTLSKRYDSEANEIDYQHLISDDYINFSQVLEFLYARLNSPESGDECRLKFTDFVQRIFWFWFVSGELKIGRQWLERAIDALPSGQTFRKSKLLQSLGNIVRDLGEHETAFSLFRQSRELIHDTEDVNHLAGIIQSYGISCIDTGKFEEARHSLLESMKMFQDTGNRSGEGRAHLNYGVYCMRTGDVEQAKSCFEKSTRIFEQLGEKGRLAVSYINLGLTWGLENIEREEEFYQKSLKLFSELKSPGGVAHCCHCLGVLCLLRGEIGPAYELGIRSLKSYFEIGDRTRCISPLDHLATIFLKTGKISLAARISGALEKYIEDHHLVNYDYSEFRDKRETLVTETLDQDQLLEWSAEFKHGQGESIDSAIKTALKSRLDPIYSSIQH